MAKVQIVFAMTIDGYVPDERQALMQWIQNRHERFPLLAETVHPHFP